MRRTPIRAAAFVGAVGLASLAMFGAGAGASTEPPDTDPMGTEAEGTEAEGTEADGTDAEGTAPELTFPDDLDLNLEARVGRRVGPASFFTGAVGHPRGFSLCKWQS